MLTLYASMTKLFRKLERTMKVVAHEAGDKARVRANEVLKRMNETADEMRRSASELEGRAASNFKDEQSRISSVLEGI